MLSNSYLRLIILGIFLLAATNVFANETLVFAIDLIRHGDRTPIYQVPKSPYFWQEGLGGLTAKGIEQEIQLGKQLRKEYIDQHQLLPRSYNSSRPINCKT
jgi:lysosomal acid phosphatase